MIVRVYLRRDARRVAREGQSWIREDRIMRVQGPADPLALAQVFDSKQRALGWGLYSPDSAIRVRMLSWDPQALPTGWLAGRIRRALAVRARLGLGPKSPVDSSRSAHTTGYREVNSEGDGLPGLVIDRYGAHRVVQITTAPMHARQQEIVECLRSLDPQVDVLVLRPQRAARAEGFPAGFEGEALESMHYLEHGIDFRVPGPPTQKTGGYHDQRENRRIVAQLAAADGRPLLDLGSHVGGFCVHAAARGIDAVAVDASALMLDYVERNAQGHPGTITRLKADMFAPFDSPSLDGPFGTIVFDPPKIASSPRDKARASAATRLALRNCVARLAPGGYLVVCSCSHHFGRPDIEACVQHVSEAAARPVRLLRSLGPGEDHPVQSGHEQGEYLRVNVYRFDTEAKPER